MGMRKEKEGTLKDGREVTKYTLINRTNLQVSFYDLGAVITNLWMPDRDGNLDDIVLGYDNPEAYAVNVPSFGAPVGRYANRISNGKITVGGKEYLLDQNNGTNCLHGGRLRFNHMMYQAQYKKGEGEQSLCFSRRSPDGEQGFPGNLDYSITYTLTNDNELIIEYRAVSDQDTVINLTNHSYFNLGPGGHLCKSVLEEEVMIHSERYTPLNENLVPTGEFLPVQGTPLDFRNYKKLGADLVTDPSSPDYLPGYDHNYVLRDNPENVIQEAALLRDKRTGRLMRVLTDRPGLQLYTAPKLREAGGKEGMDYGPSSAVCFESQAFPNAVNTPGFPSPLLHAGEEFYSKTVYQFLNFRGDSLIPEA